MPLFLFFHYHSFDPLSLPFMKKTTKPAYTNGMYFRLRAEFCPRCNNLLDHIKYYLNPDKVELCKYCWSAEKHNVVGRFASYDCVQDRQMYEEYIKDKCIYCGCQLGGTKAYRVNDDSACSCCFSKVVVGKKPVSSPSLCDCIVHGSKNATVHTKALFSVGSVNNTDLVISGPETRRFQEYSRNM